MTKKEARIYAKKLLESTHVDWNSVVLQFLAPLLQAKKRVIFYRAHPPEPNLDFLEKLYPEILFFYPKIISKTEKTLEFLFPSNWKKGEYGIWEPEGKLGISPTETELCIIPCLGCNLLGYRLGRGGGFYDKAMQGIPKSKLVGITLRELSQLDFPSEAHDLQYGIVITPSAINFHEPIV